MGFFLTAYAVRRARLADTVGSQSGKGGLGCHESHREEGLWRSLAIVRPPQALWEVVEFQHSGGRGRRTAVIWRLARAIAGIEHFL